MRRIFAALSINITCSFSALIRADVNKTRGSILNDHNPPKWVSFACRFTTPTQVGRALAQLGIELIPAYSPEARRRSERMFGTLQKRLPQELRLAGITDMVEANRFLKEVFLPQHNARFATPAEDRGTAFVPFTGALDDILCIHEERTVSNDNTVRYKRLALQIPAGRHRRHYVKARVRVHEYPDGTMAVFHGPRCLARYHADGQPIDSQTREAA